MEYVLDQTSPIEKNFEAICRVPHGSFHEQKISDFLTEFAKNHGLKYHQQSCGNVIIYKDGTEGYEDHAPVMLQGHMDMDSMCGLVGIGCVVCGIVCVAADTSQDLKTGFLIGATPKRQQIGEFIGVCTSAMVIGAIMFLLNEAWGYGTEELPAPTAALMRMVIEGVMGGNLPWNLILIGVFIALIAELFRIPVLPFGVGMYLPIYTSVGIMFGGIIRLLVDKKKYASEEQHKECADNGVLYCSGLIAGEGVVGIVLAAIAVIPFKSGTLADVVNISSVFNIGQIGALVVFALLIATIYRTATKIRKK